MKTINAFYLGIGECILSLILGYMWKDFVSSIKDKEYTQKDREISALFQSVRESLDSFEMSLADINHKEKIYDPLEKLDNMSRRIMLSERFNELLTYFPEYMEVRVTNLSGRNNITDISGDFHIKLKY